MLEIDLGDFLEDATVHLLWDTNAPDGSSVTRATDGEVRVYKSNGMGQTTAGITDTEDFDGLTGVHAITIDLSADAFYAPGKNYVITVSAMTVDGKVVNHRLAMFSVQNRVGSAPILPSVAPHQITVVAG